MIDLDYLWLDLLVLVPILEDDMKIGNLGRCPDCDAELTPEDMEYEECDECR